MRIFFIYAAFIVSLGILAGLSILYNWQFREWARYNNAIEHTQIVLSNLDNLISYLKDTETSGRGYLLAQDSAFLEPFHSAEDSIEVLAKRIVQLTRDNPAQQEQAHKLNAIIKKRMDVLYYTNVMSHQNRQMFRKSLRRGKEIMDSCRVQAKVMKAIENDLLEKSKIMKNKYAIVAPNTFLIIFSFTILVFLISFMVLTGELRNRKKYQRQLERNLVELDQFNQELNQITHISSHDLQEPLRKLSIFSDQLLFKYNHQLNDDARLIVGRIAHASSRIRELIDDLSKYTSLTQIDTQPKNVNLNLEVEKLMVTKFPELKPESLQLAKTLVVKGHPHQVRLLFECLLHNSIKFAKPGTDLLITISKGRLAKEELKQLRDKTGQIAFDKIVVRDNGIGFEIIDDRIFQIFQKLNTDHEGKGVGLALVKRIMNNHKGHVVAKGEVNVGATFTLYFPKDAE